MATWGVTGGTTRGHLMLSSARRGMGLLGYQNAQFQKAVHTVSLNAAQVARLAAVDRFNSRLSGRPYAPPRVGRPTTQGQFATNINYVYDHRSGLINLDLRRLEAAAPYYLINEVGTNQQVTMQWNVPASGGGFTPKSRSETIASQKGRQIGYRMGARGPQNLLWASGPGAQGSSGHGGMGSDQIYPRSLLLAQNVSHRRRIIINREIRGKHYLKTGAETGMNVYRRGIQKAVRTIYR